MKKVCILLVLAFCGARAYAHEYSIFDVCTGVTKNLNSLVGFTLEEEFWGDTKITGNDTWFMTAFNLAPWCTVEPFFCYGTDQFEHHLYREYRYGGNLSFSGNFKDWYLKFRSRLSLRDKEIEDDMSVQSRNRFHAGLPWKWTEYDISPYVQYEIFFDSRRQYHSLEHCSGHRGTIGIQANLTEHVYFALFYIRHMGRYDDDWKPTNMYGTTIYFTY